MKKSVRTSLGELRPSQLLYSFGVGSIVDLPHISAMVMGLEDWETAHVKPIREDRLLSRIRRFLGPQVDRLCTPPIRDETVLGLRSPFDENAVIGVPVAPFPRWMRCPACGLLAPLNSGLLQLRVVPGRPDLAKYVHINCNKLKQPAVLPARFLLACESGHLDDFPWIWFVHRGQQGCNGPLELQELGVSGEAADVQVVCRGCDKKRRMSEAFGKDAARNLPICRGRRPQLRDFEDEPCNANRQTILLGASNVWFPVTHSALYVPSLATDRLEQLVEEHWDVLSDVTNPAIITFLRNQGNLSHFADFDDEALWDTICLRREAGESEEEKEEDIKEPEWRVFANPDPSLNGLDFELREVEAPPRWKPYLERVILVERLREVTALTAFTRIASPRDYEEAEEMPRRFRASISRNPPTFIPATEVRGEGIFLQFNEERISSWCNAQSMREDLFRMAHTSWRRRRGIANPDGGFPGIRFVLLHSFAHALMRELALECGYTAASLRERIYSRDETDEGPAMAGVLIYTAAPDSEGTLGGLVRMGRPEELDRHIHNALFQIRLCSSDPLCADHDPDPDGTTLHGAACHACLFAPETSCERGNKYLDRSVLISTVRGELSAFFEVGV